MRKRGEVKRMMEEGFAHMEQTPRNSGTARLFVVFVFLYPIISLLPNMHFASVEILQVVATGSAVELTIRRFTGLCVLVFLDVLPVFRDARCEKLGRA